MTSATPSDSPSRHDSLSGVRKGLCFSRSAALVLVVLRDSAVKGRWYPQWPIPCSFPVGDHSVYACDTRCLGQQRCEDCGVFMRRIGFGGLCPCCDEPVATIELVPKVSECRDLGTARVVL